MVEDEFGYPYLGSEGMAGGGWVSGWCSCWTDLRMGGDLTPFSRLFSTSRELEGGSDFESRDGWRETCWEAEGM